MQRATLICIIGDRQLCTELFERYKDHIPPGFPPYAYEYDGWQLNLRLKPDSPELKEALDIVQAKHCGYHLFSDVAYTKKELKEMPFFHLRPPSPFELEGTNPESYGTQYTGGCLHCGLGKKAVGDILVRSRFVRKYKMSELEPEVVASEDLQTLILDYGFTGISFGAGLRDYKGREMPAYRTMEIDHILPPMSQSTWLEPYEISAYAPCGHHIIFLRSEVQYEKEKLIGAKDFNLTEEYINNRRQRIIIVSARVREAFRKHKITAIYDPVTLL